MFDKAQSKPPNRGDVKSMNNNEILVMAGIAAAQKWDIDLTKVNVMIVDSLAIAILQNKDEIIGSIEFEY
jgi:hypothetical protein